MPVLANRFRQEILKADEEPGWINESLDGIAAAFEGWASREHDELGRHESLTFKTLRGQSGPAIQSVSGTLTSNIKETLINSTSEVEARSYFVKAGLAARDGDVLHIIASGSMLGATTQLRYIKTRINGALVGDAATNISGRNEWEVDIKLARLHAKAGRPFGRTWTGRAEFGNEGGAQMVDTTELAIDFERQIKISIGLHSGTAVNMRVFYFAVRFEAA